MPKESIERLIAMIARHLQTFINKRLEPYNLATGQFMFFMGIHRHPGLSQDALSDIVQTDKVTTSKMVKRLVEKGYVRKVANPRDRRYFQLYLSDEGRAILPAIRRILDETTDILASGLTPEEERQARALLPRMLANIARSTQMMKSEQEFLNTLAALKHAVSELPDVVDATRIQQTAERLEKLHFTPTLMLPFDRFLRCSKAEMLAEIDRVAALTEQDIRDQGVEIKQDAQEIQVEQIGMLAYHFKLLTRLRQDEARAWDEIDELYGDD